MNKLKFIRSLIGVTTAAAAVFSAVSPLAPVSAFAEGTENTENTDAVSNLPDRLMNGSFEWPKVETFVDNDLGNGEPNNYIDTSGKSHNIGKENGDTISFTNNNPWLVTTVDLFEDAVKKEDAAQGAEQHGQFYWKTTAHEQRVELLTDNASMIRNFWNQYDPNSVSAPEASDGNQFAELVAEERASLYQNIRTEPGSVLTWSLDHRGRVTQDNNGISNNGVDTMALFIGPAQEGDITKTDDGLDSQDLFIAMVEQLYPDYGETQPGNQLIERTFYSKPITDESPEIQVSVTPTAECTDEWKCWIITDNSEKWNTRSGTYTVPADQTATTFAFTPLTGATQSSDTYNRGNCLDNIQFSKQYPLIVTAMDGVSGTISGGGITNSPVASYENEYTGSADADDTVTIGITLTDNRQFIGATINGEFMGVDKDSPEEAVECGYFTKDENGNYTLNLTMDKAKNVHLICGTVGEVRYDPNGGTLPDDFPATNGVYAFTYSTDPLTVIQEPTPPTGSTFLRWEVYASDGKTSLGGQVGINHTVTYNGQTDTFTIKEPKSEAQEFEIAGNADEYAIVLRAVYSHTLSVQSCTRHIGYEVIHNDSSGGTVTVTNDTDSSSSSGDSITVDQGDRFTVTATANEGYRLESWWYSYTNDNNTWTMPIQINDAAVDNGTYTSTFRGSRNVMIHAQFVEISTAPYLAAVAQDETAETILREAGITNVGTVAQQSGSSVYNNDGAGGSKYGNTIATGFFVERDFGSTAEKLSGVWTITVPVVGTFIKVPDGEIENGNPDNEKYPHLSETNLVILDKNVTTGSGSIYKAERTSSDGVTANPTKQYRFYAESNTTVSGGGSAVFGVIIDNLYAPSAFAGFRQFDSKDDAKISNELTDENSVNADKKTHYDQSKLDNLDNTSTQNIE